LSKLIDRADGMADEPDTTEEPEAPENLIPTEADKPRPMPD
jgi:hypothetical protein